MNNTMTIPTLLFKKKVSTLRWFPKEAILQVKCPVLVVRQLDIKKGNLHITQLINSRERFVASSDDITEASSDVNVFILG